MIHAVSSEVRVPLLTESLSVTFIRCLIRNLCRFCRMSLIWGMAESYSCGLKTVLAYREVLWRTCLDIMREMTERVRLKFETGNTTKNSQPLHPKNVFPGRCCGPPFLFLNSFPSVLGTYSADKKSLRKSMIPDHQLKSFYLSEVISSVSTRIWSI
jgi:hypothetical protein